MIQANITRAVLPAFRREELAETCLRRLPDETCGILLGFSRGNIVYVDEFQVIRNIAPNPENAFMFDPADWVRVFYEAKNQRKSIVGLFHSHPDGQLAPSHADTKSQLLWGTYWIVAISGRECRIAAYLPVEGGSWEKVPIEET